MGGQDSLGQWLNQRCKRERLSLRQAAARTGLTHTTIADVIKGERPLPETIRKLVRAFGGDGQQRLVLEDHLLTLAGYRTPRAEGEEPSEIMAELMDRAKQLNDPQIRMMINFADFLAEVEASQLVEGNRSS